MQCPRPAAPCSNACAGFVGAWVDELTAAKRIWSRSPAAPGLRRQPEIRSPVAAGRCLHRLGPLMTPWPLRSWLQRSSGHGPARSGDRDGVRVAVTRLQRAMGDPGHLLLSSRSHSWHRSSSVLPPAAADVFGHRLDDPKHMVQAARAFDRPPTARAVPVPVRAGHAEALGATAGGRGRDRLAAMKPRPANSAGSRRGGRMPRPGAAGGRPPYTATALLPSTRRAARPGFPSH